MLALLRTIRPHQWVKNAFVAAPLVFSRHLENTDFLWREAFAVVAFCLLSGAVYLFNDVRDVEADRRHPTKKYRPIAAGELSQRAALVWSAIFATVALGGCLALRWQLAMWAALYFAQNIAYSVRLKHVAFVDVSLLASGFIFRVLAGAAAIDVPASKWLLACTALLALFFGLGKRAHELAWVSASAGASGSTGTRAALSGYRLGVVKPAIYVLAIATVAAYVAYTLDVHTIELFGTRDLVYSAPFVAIGIARFLSLALWRPRIDSPTDAMLRDPWFLLDLVLATATVLYIIYG